MKTLKILLTLNLFCFFHFCFAQQNIDTSQSILSWTGKAAFNSYSPTGTIKVKEGSIQVDNNTITNLKVVIDMKSLDHKISDLKNHLRNKDFFEVNKYKTATFEIINPSQIIDGKVSLIGIMTIKGTSKEENVLASITQDGQININFEFTLDRTEYGIKFNSPNFFKKLKENAIADEFNLKGNLVFKQ